MHAQTTTTPAQANEATPIGALNTMAACLAGPDPISASLAAAIEAVHVYDRDIFAVATRDHSETEIELQRAEAVLRQGGQFHDAIAASEELQVAEAAEAKAEASYIQACVERDRLVKLILSAAQDTPADIAAMTSAYSCLVSSRHLSGDPQLIGDADDLALLVERLHSAATLAHMPDLAGREIENRIHVWEDLTEQYDVARAAESAATSKRARAKAERESSKLLDALALQVADIVNVRTTEPRLMLRKYEVIQKELYNNGPEEVAAKLATRRVGPPHDPWDGEHLLDGIMADIYALANTPAQPSLDRAEWGQALEATRKAKARYDALQGDYYGRITASRVGMPAEIARASTWYGQICRWHSVQNLAEDDFLPAEEKARLTPILAAWLQAETTISAELDENEDVRDQANDEWLDLERRLIELKAPDIFAEADRLELVGHMNQYGAIDINDLAGLMLESQTFAGRCALNASLAILRAAGRPVPIVDTFDAQAWIKNYEELGGVVSGGLDNLIIASVPSLAETEVMRTELYANPARAWVVHEVAKTRCSTGGDKVYLSGWDLRQGQDFRDNIPDTPFDRIDTWRDATGDWRIEVTTFNGRADPTHSESYAPAMLHAAE